MGCPVFFEDFEKIALYSDSEEVARKFQRGLSSKEDFEEYMGIFKRILTYEPKNQEKEES